MATLVQARAAKAAALKQLRDRDDIAGIGLTKEGAGYAIKVNLRSPSNSRIPARIKGVPLRVEHVGTIRALTK